MFSGLAFPELLVRDVIASSLAQLLGNDALLDAILATRPSAEVDSIRTALAVRPGGDAVRLGFPLESVEDWQVTVAGSAEPVGVLGDVAGRLEPETVAVVTLTDAIGPEDGVVLPLGGPAPAEFGTSGRVELDEEAATYRVSAGVVTLTRRGVAGSRPATHAAGTRVAAVTFTQLVGGPYRHTLRVDIVSSSALFTMVVGHMLVPFLRLRRDDFETAGFVLQTIAESDLQARPVAWPAHFYSRTLTITGMTKVALPEALGPLIIDEVVELEVAAA